MVKEENKPFAELLGKLLRRRRLEMGMTQAEFAWITKMSEEGYGRIERGESIPTTLTLSRIHNNTGISMDRIFQEIDRIEKENKPEEE
ncbi:helix-turn-helix domain-containing protein [Rossellomorea aquimaris]|uniref:Helix-turn-helix transcriptional regulator n=1 Tax=Rossellomorea aquimaris TaxID=189382 RepID=A0A5D4UL58_9BACI|nr:helix-turn-helix transcriptional regulator [Rossellomorea aquimaris]TYS81712.1 helix-turn-helix transcriptional regulator [Rossellomorea aquimaris]TYS88337.1 helix-turn-helix transcriptional regulator [Rossellomorea aquimaris]